MCVEGREISSPTDILSSLRTAATSRSARRKETQNITEFYLDALSQDVFIVEEENYFCVKVMSWLAFFQYSCLYSLSLISFLFHALSLGWTLFGWITLKGQFQSWKCPSSQNGCDDDVDEKCLALLQQDLKPKCLCSVQLLAGHRS